jgi:hypothetical protein
LALGQVAREIAIRHGLGEQPALALVAAFELGSFQLFAGLDALDVVLMPRLRARPTTARTRTNERSILILSNGKLRR